MYNISRKYKFSQYIFERFAFHVFVYIRMCLYHMYFAFYLPLLFQFTI